MDCVSEVLDKNADAVGGNISQNSCVHFLCASLQIGKVC